MKIKVLDRAAMGYDISFDALNSFGEVELFDKTTAEELLGKIHDADVIILNKIKLTKEVLLSATNLKLVCVFATGYDNVDIVTAKERGIAVCNVPAYSTDSVVLTTIATTLSLVAHLNEYSAYVKSGEYSKGDSPNKLSPTYHELKGKTWGIIGYGNIGRSVAMVAEALGANVIVNKRTACENLKVVDIDTLCKESDVITIHCPLNNETRELINPARIALMKDGVVVVNEARGAVLDETAVADAVISGKIGAFGCDVYSLEPFPISHPYNRILGMDNVILTPHCAWAAKEARERCVNVICNNISSYINGEILNRVDK